ncbi:pectinesterase inhibitor 6-like [Apium graveolens]|uniref:pectinesterase inhibitor 6-like n=1 Tax=Apium graveolens TaxID=4045 RepID=UPI003D7A42F7
MSHIMSIFLSLTILALLTDSASSENGDDYVQDACSVTRYRNLCIRSLSPFSTTAKRNPTTWARAGVSVTIGEAKRVANHLRKLSSNTGGRDKGALLDCVECFQDSIDNLHKSLYVLRELNGQTFNSQMSDVTTWMSAALTDEDTCLDGFSGHQGRQIKSLQSRIKNVTYITSNALALVNKLATTGISSP